MIVPFIISVSREVLLTVPREQREAALALGATRWESTWQVVVPWARTGIFGSIFLALARALGETMAVTMVIGNDPKIAASLFAPGYTIAAVIANEFTEATGNLYLSALIELGLVLFLMTFILNGLARILDRRNRARRRTPIVSDLPAALAESAERGDAYSHRRGRFCGGLGPVPDTRLSGLERRQIPELGFLHEIAEASRRNRRRHGECHRWQFEACCSWRPLSVCQLD